jgi:hypothetical protein
MSFVLNVASFFGLSIFDCPFVFPKGLFTSVVFNYSLLSLVLIFVSQLVCSLILVYEYKYNNNTLLTKGNTTYRHIQSNILKTPKDLQLSK